MIVIHTRRGAISETSIKILIIQLFLVTQVGYVGFGMAQPLSGSITPRHAGVMASNYTSTIGLDFPRIFTPYLTNDPLDVQ